MPRFAMLGARRQVLGTVAGALMLTLITAALVSTRDAESLVVAAVAYQLVIVLVAVIGGLLPSLAAAVAAGAMLNYFFVTPLHTVFVSDVSHAIAIGVFIVVGAIVSFIVGQSEARLALVGERADALGRAAAAQDADRMKTALLQAVGHDLRTPLAAASASVSSLASTDIEWTPSQRAELLDTASASLRKLERLVDDLLDRSRLEAGVLATMPERMRVEDAVSLALDELSEVGATVGVRVAPALPDAFADPVLVQRIVANVVRNAIRHAGGDITVALDADSQWVRVGVIDHGPGIPEGVREDAFLPFQRLDDVSSGVGLGLALARGFAEALGGRLTAHETPGGGLTVVLTLPAARSDDAPSSGAERS